MWPVMTCWAALAAAEVSPMVEYQSVAVRDVCAWPNLTVLPDGGIVALIFNRPSHGQLAGDIDCHATTDAGRTWELRGTAARRDDERSNRMNCAAGLAGNGDLVAVVSGYGRIGDEAPFIDRMLPAMVTRSSDGGRTWRAEGTFATADDGQLLVPFGDIAIGADGRLRLSAYTARTDRAAYLLTSPDDGRTWERPIRIGAGLNECAPLHLGGGRWLAAIRTYTPADVHLLASDDDGATWTDRGPVTQGKEHPAHLLRLRDGRLVLTYGNRRAEQPGVEAKLSSDDGRTWGEPIRLVELPMVDLGYPSSVELPDGRILTAYYAAKGPGCDGYHMGVVTWRPQ